MKLDYSWSQLKKIGDFYFGVDLDSYKNRYNLIRDPELADDISGGWESYVIDCDHYTGIRIDVENGLIVSISCYLKLYFKGKNIIGMSAEDAISLIGESPDKIGDALIVKSEEQTTLEFDKLGLMLWVSTSGIVVSADCSGDLSE